MYDKTIFKTRRSFEKYCFIEYRDVLEVTWADLNELVKYNRINYLGNFPDDNKLPFALFAVTKEKDILGYYCVALH